MKVKIKKNDIVKITFHDHCMGIDEPMLCQVYGRIEKKTKLYLVISCWDLIHLDEKIKKDNREIFTILRKTIVGIDKLCYED